MSKELIVTLLRKDIAELSQLTDGFEQLEIFPPVLLRLFTPKDGGEGLAPTYRTLGRWKYVGYVTSLVLCHQAAMLLFELFSFFNPIDMLIAYVGSSALTLMLVLVLGRLQGKKNRDTVHGG